MFSLNTFATSIPYIASGVIVTLEYTILSVGLGLILGTLLALTKISRSKKLRLLRWFAAAYTSVFRGTPLLLQLSLIYFATPQLTGYKISAFEAGILAFSLNSAAYVSEVIRAGIQAVDKGQWEAAYSLGLPYHITLKAIIMPQALKNILPALVNEIVNLLKESALVSIIGESDLLRRANIVAAEKFVYFEPLLVAAIMYYIMVMVLTWSAQILEKRLKRSDSY